jgi:hypothetical protein
MPSLFCALAVFWSSGSALAWPQSPLAMVYTVAMALWTPWRMTSHQGPLIKSWLWVMLTLLYYLALALIEGVPWPDTFSLKGSHALWFLAGFVQGQLGVLWAGQLAPRARLFLLIQEIPEGKRLEDRVRDFQLDADFSQTNLRTLSASLVVMGGAAAVSASASFGHRILTAGLLFGFLTVCLLVGVLLRVYRREMQAFMYGRRFTLADKLAPLGWSALLIVLAASASWVLLGRGGPLFDWSRWLVRPEVPVSLPPSVAPEAPPNLWEGGDPRLAVLLALLWRIFRFQNLVFVFSCIGQLLFWLLPWTAAAFLLWPPVRWFLSGRRETRGLGRRWWRLLKAQWWAFWAALMAWWRRTEPRSPVQTLGVSGVRDWLGSLWKRPARGSRRPYPKVVEAFLSLVKWAAPLTVYRGGETTREFFDRLSLLIPEHAPELGRARDLLDQELFAPRGLDSQGRNAFLGLIVSLTSRPPSHESPPRVS